MTLYMYMHVHVYVQLYGHVLEVHHEIQFVTTCTVGESSVLLNKIVQIGTGAIAIDFLTALTFPVI